MKEADIAFHLFWTECNKIHDDVEGTAFKTEKARSSSFTSQSGVQRRAISAVCEKREFYALLDGQEGDGADGSCPPIKSAFMLHAPFFVL
ncbi:MAG: hypothetical protein ACLS8R_03740 [Anaeromassilibacillus sp.]